MAGTARQLADAAGIERTADRAAMILAAMRAPLEARYADAAVRLADLERLADAAADSPSLQDALVQLALDPPVSAADLAGRPRLDDDFLVISTMPAKGPEWPVVHLPPSLSMARCRPIWPCPRRLAWRKSSDCSMSR